MGGSAVCDSTFGIWASDCKPGSGRFVGRSVYIMLYNVNGSPGPLLPGLVRPVAGSFSGFCACYISGDIRRAVTLSFPSFHRLYLSLSQLLPVSFSVCLAHLPALRIYGSEARKIPYFFLFSLVFYAFLSFALFFSVSDS